MGKHATNAIDPVRELWAYIYIYNNNNNNSSATLPHGWWRGKILIFQTAFVWLTGLQRLVTYGFCRPCVYIVRRYRRMCIYMYIVHKLAHSTRGATNLAAPKGTIGTTLSHTSLLIYSFNLFFYFLWRRIVGSVLFFTLSTK